MTSIRNVNFYDGKQFQGQPVDLTLRRGQSLQVNCEESNIDTTIDGVNLIALPALIDPHVHFRTPGNEHKENWKTASKAALAGGYTTVLDMPNTSPPCTTLETVTAKHALIQQQLQDVGLQDLHYGLYLGGDRNQFDQIPKVKDQVIAIKVYMGSSTGSLLMDDEKSLRKLFQIAKENNLLVAVHAEDEEMIRKNTAECPNKCFSAHSNIRNTEVARKATELAIRLTREIGNRLYIVHVSTMEELDAIRKAKAEKLPVYAEATPHHLFLNTRAYDQLEGRAQMNPPLRHSQHNQALLEAINEGVIDTIGTDHAPHTLEEKAKPYGEGPGCCPSGVPGIETALPLLLDAYSKRLITLQKIVDITHNNPKKIFGLPDRSDVVLVDLNRIYKVEGAKLHTKCKWSPFEGMELKGAPIVTVLEGKAYNVSNSDLGNRVEGQVHQL